MRDVYYEEELRYLKEEGARFAKKYPQRAGYLNLESARDRDPKVEALFEGFAFIAAGIRERIDDALPSLAEGLTGLVWPQFLHPIPALCIAEFRARPGTLQGACVLSRGTPLFADPDPDTGVACQFALTQDVRVNPISVWAAQADDGDGKDSLTLAFKLEKGLRPEALSLSPVRIFINDELPAALHIRKMLLHHAEEVTLSDDAGRSMALPPRDVFAEGGFGEGDGLYPEPQRAGRALGLIRDYFAFPERFMFIDIRGLDALAGRAGRAASALSLQIRFDRKFSAKVSLSRDTFKLHCAPAANVFRRDAEPILADGRRREYDLVPDAARPECFAIHSVASVVGIDCATGERRCYERYGKIGGGQRFYSIRAEELSGDGLLYNNGRRLKLSMNGRQTEGGRLIRETLHIEAWQTNGALARKALTEGGALRKAAPDFPDYIAFTNITKPGPPINPPGGDKYLWTFLSHLAAAYTNFGDAESLRELLRAYDWGGGRAAPRPEIEAIRSVSITPIDIAVDKAVIRGAEMNITADESAAPEDGLFLLGAVLARSLSCMASINTFLKLTITLPVSGKSYAWRCRSGERWEV